jgi:hypothetical protein
MARPPNGVQQFLDARLRRGDRYGLRSTRNVPHVGREVTELAIELRGNTIYIANQEGALRPRAYSYFDESRAAFVALLREAMAPALRERIPDE